MQQPGTKSGCGPHGKPVAIFPHSVSTYFRLFVHPKSRPGGLSSVPSKASGRMSPGRTDSPPPRPAPPRPAPIAPTPGWRWSFVLYAGAKNEERIPASFNFRIRSWNKPPCHNLRSSAPRKRRTPLSKIFGRACRSEDRLSFDRRFEDGGGSSKKGILRRTPPSSIFGDRQQKNAHLIFDLPGLNIEEAPSSTFSAGGAYIVMLFSSSDLRPLQVWPGSLGPRSSPTIFTLGDRFEYRDRSSAHFRSPRVSTEI